MAEFCSCGAQLPPDALFCHKCGKPQRDLVAPEIERNTYPAAVEIQPPLPPPRIELPLNFRNPIAVRIALVAAVISTVLGLLIMPILNWLAAGFFAVYFYCRQTGSHLDVSSGVKIGWITGLITYALSAVVFAAEQLPDALSGHPGKTLLDAMKNSPLQDPATVQRLTAMIQTEPAMWILLMLVALFVFVTSLSMVGGAIGAKFLGSPKV